MVKRVEIDSLVSITSITVESYASPEGDSSSNQKLSARRSQSMYNYLRDQLNIADSLITVGSRGVAWGRLREMVFASDMADRDEIINIIDNVPEERWRRLNPTDRWLTLVDSRNKHLMDLRGGQPYNYMQQNLYAQLRSSSIVTIYFRRQEQPIIRDDIEFDQPELRRMDLPLYEPIEETKTPIKFAVKSNLLYDILLTPSIEVEVPIGKRWSVAGEWICPWWITKDNGSALQIMSGVVEGRYWFGDRTDKAQLTGWFAGLYASGGLYDLQWRGNGYQGEFYIAAGLAGGYAHTINKKGNLRMEYSLGLGYLCTKYRYYEGQQNNKYLVWQHDGRYSWVGPTKAKVSLAWFITWQRGGKR